MQIFVIRNGQQTGPYPPAQIQRELASGSLHANDLAWYEGAANWLPLALVPGLSAGAPFPGQAFYPVAAPQTSGVAVASMVLGLLSLFTGCLTALPAIICGHIALSQIKHSMGRLGGRGMAITGLAVGYVFIVLFAIILAAIALPVFNSVSERGRAVKSIAEAKQIGLACKLYAGDNDGHFPKTLDELVPTYLSDKHLFVCPLDSSKSPMGYEYFGGMDDDDLRKVLLQSKAMTHDGKRVVVYTDNFGELVKQ